jgi:hypothetical protein
MEKRRIPVFASESEEAKWWYDNREALADDMVAAIREGRLGEGSKARWARLQAEKQQSESPVVAPASSASKAA